MKYIFSLALILVIVTSNAQTTKIDTAEFKNYSACTECFEKWKTTPIQNASPSQQHILTQNQMAQQSINGAKSFGRTLKTIAVGIVVGAITLVIINKTTQATNAITNTH